MTTISMLQFRRNAEDVVRRVQRGERLVLTYRGKPVARLEPIRDAAPDKDDPFYSLPLAAQVHDQSLTNEEMDRIIYG